MVQDGPRRPQKAKNAWKKGKNDFVVMETNSSSIVSKSSVERLYFAGKRKPFYRHFVKKPARRSPIVNRGYWARIYALEKTVRTFLTQPSRNDRKKVVVNLGCGFDPLPFQILSEEQWKDVIFVDVDYFELMDKKMEIIQQNEELSKIVKNPIFETGIIKARSENYVAIGCDLSDVVSLKKALESTGLAQESLLFMAEVSITYMERPDADAVIKFASGFEDSSFVLLEQLMPGGIEHPFAEVMMAQFKSINSLIKSVPFYPTLSSQVGRFKERGWKYCNATDLCGFFQEHIPEETRKSLNDVEAFDEWEEFYMFAQHYVLLFASTADEEWPRKFTSQKAISTQLSTSEGTALKMHNTGLSLKRKFGAATIFGGDSVLYNGGAECTRESGSFLITKDKESKFVLSSEKPAARMSHTLNTLADGTVVGLGGRFSPKEVLNDALVFKDDKWKTTKLPETASRYRHSTVTIRNQLLVFGGRDGSGTTFNRWDLRDEKGEWITLSANVEVPARSAAVLINDPIDKAQGILCGGITESGTALDDIWSWKLVDNCSVVLEKWEDTLENGYSLGARFGAQAVHGLRDHTAIIAGGISKHRLMPYDEYIVEVDFEKRVLRPLRWTTARKPMLVGMSCVRTKDSILVIGGGGNCYSFGSYFNNEVLEIKMAGAETNSEPWLLKAEEVAEEPKAGSAEVNGFSAPTTNGGPVTFREIPRIRLETAEDFDTVVNSRQPSILEEIDVGSCIEKWTPEYLLEKVGADRNVVIHSSKDTHMNFQRKNFAYETVPFSQFIKSAFDPTSKDSYYLRSIASVSPSTNPANIYTDYPEIASDFSLPDTLSRVKENMHSCPLRISGANIGMWLHYDVMANILVHVRGRKRFRLYPPSDILSLSFPAGSTNSNILNIFDENVPGTSPYEIELKPGDVLYIPELWPHAAFPLEPCVAVNVFFKNLGEAYAAGRDVYGNRDIGGYENGRRALGRIEQGFKGVPTEVRRFYLERLAAELLDIARKTT